MRGAKSLMRGGYNALHAAAANGSADCLQDLIDAGSSLRHSASESSLRGGSATALELAEAPHRGRAVVASKQPVGQRVREVRSVGKAGGRRGRHVRRMIIRIIIRGRPTD